MKQPIKIHLKSSRLFSQKENVIMRLEILTLREEMGEWALVEVGDGGSEMGLG